MNDALQNDLIYQFSTLLVVLDPIATVPVFMSLSKDLNRKDSIRLALYSVLFSFGILLFFIIFGQIFLNALNIPLPSFQLAGSILLFLLGLEMVRGKTEGSIKNGVLDASLVKRAAYPLAIPVIAGAAGMLTVVMLTNNDTRTIAQQAQTTVLLALCLSIHFISFSLSGYIKKYIGDTGIETISRVFGLILTSIAVTGIITAIKASFGLT
jgi:multiple antibiotic resistance protein